MYMNNVKILNLNLEIAFHSNQKNANDILNLVPAARKSKPCLVYSYLSALFNVAWSPDLLVKNEQFRSINNKCIIGEANNKVIIFSDKYYSGHRTSSNFFAHIMQDDLDDEVYSNVATLETKANNLFKEMYLKDLDKISSKEIISNMQVLYYASNNQANFSKNLFDFVKSKIDYSEIEVQIQGDLTIEINGIKYVLQLEQIRQKAMKHILPAIDFEDIYFEGDEVYLAELELEKIINEITASFF